MNSIPNLSNTFKNNKISILVTIGIIVVFIIGMINAIYNPRLSSFEIERKSISNFREQVKNYDWVDDEILNVTEDGNNGIKVLVKDNFLEKTLKEQFTLSNNLFEILVNKSKELGDKKPYFTLSIGNNNKEFYIYRITNEKFKLISTGLEIPRNQITNGQFDYTTLDKTIINEGKINGKDSVQVNREVDEVLAKTDSGKSELITSDDDRVFAWTAAKSTVEKSLKAPSTAKFPFSYNGQNIKQTSNDTFIVNSYVDAQNEFGAMIRSNFSVTIKKTSSNSYTVENIHIDQ